jgi:hypothetical protein
MINHKFLIFLELLNFKTRKIDVFSGNKAIEDIVKTSFSVS